jgi:hypothetical protein
VNRSASLAMYPAGKRNEDRMLVFIPVVDEKSFPLKFVEILKKMAANEKADLYPAITEYRGHIVYQIQRDMFTTAMDGVFIIGSTGELLRSVIDVKENNAGYLDLDPMYTEYRSKSAKNYDLRIYVTGAFLKDIVRTPVRKEVEPKKETTKPADSAFNRAMLKEARYFADAGTARPSVRSELDRMSAGPSPFNAVDYASLGLSVKPSAITIDVSARLNNSSAAVNTFLDVIKTGAADRALMVNNAATYAYISFDFNKIEELCRSSFAGCGFYNELKDGIRGDLGIDFEKDIVPYYSGVLNIIAGQPKGAGGGYLFYLPMTDPAQGVKVRDKAAAYLKEKFKGTTRFGTAKIAGAQVPWYIDSKNNKVYLLSDRRGLYLGNDQELIATAVSSKAGGLPEAVTGALNPKGNGVFFLASMKKESFFGAMLMLYAYRDRDVGGVVDRMTDLSVIGEKADSLLSLSLTIRLAPRR